MAQPYVIPGLSPLPVLDNLQQIRQQAAAQQQAGLSALAPSDPNTAPVTDLAPLGEDTSAVLSPNGDANFVQKGLATGENALYAGGRAIQGLAKYAFGGDQESAAQDLQASKAYEDASAVGGNKIRSIADVHGLGDAASYAGNLALEQLPTLPLLIGTGGVGGLVGKGLARAAVETGAKDVGEALATKAAQQAAIKTGGAIGEGVGATIGGAPLTAASTTAAVTDEDPNAVGSKQERATKALIGTFASSAVGALPIVHQLQKFGAAVEAPVAATAARLMPSITKAAGAQAVGQGAAGAAQVAVALATHKWVNDHVELGDGAAMQQYLDGLIGGAVGGVVLGGAGELAARGVRPSAPGGSGDSSGGAFAAARGAAEATISKARTAFDARFKTTAEPAPTDAAAGAPADAAGTVRDPLGEALGGLKDAVGDKIGDAVTKVRDAFKSGDFKGDNNAVMSAIGDLAARAKTAAPDLKTKLTEAINAASQRLKPEDDIVMSSSPEGDDFKKHMGDDDFLKELDAASGKQPDVAAAPKADEDLERAPNQNPVRFGNGLQDVLATRIPKDNPLWAFHGEVLKPMMEGVERVYHNDYADTPEGKQQATEDGKHFDAYLSLLPADQRAKVKDQAAIFSQRSTEYRTAEADARGQDADGGEPDAQLFDTPTDGTNDGVDAGSDNTAGVEPINTGSSERTGSEDRSAVPTGLRDTDIAASGFLREGRRDFTARAAELGPQTITARNAKGESGQLNLTYLTSERLKLNRGDGSSGRESIMRAFQDGVGDAITHGYKLKASDFSADTVIHESAASKRAFQEKRAQAIREGREPPTVNQDVTKLGPKGAAIIRTQLKKQALIDAGKMTGTPRVSVRDENGNVIGTRERAPESAPGEIGRNASNASERVLAPGDGIAPSGGDIAPTMRDRGLPETSQKKGGKRTSSDYENTATDKTSPYSNILTSENGIARESNVPFQGPDLRRPAERTVMDRSEPNVSKDENADANRGILLPKNAPNESLNPLAAVYEPSDRDYASARKNPRGAAENARATAEVKIARNAIVKATADVLKALPKELHGKLAVLKDALSGKENRMAQQATVEGRNLLRDDIKRGPGDATHKAANILSITDAQAKERGLAEFSRRLLNQAPSLRGRLDKALAQAQRHDPEYNRTLQRLGKDSLVQAAKKLVESGQLSDEAYARRIEKINSDKEYQYREGLRVSERPVDTSGVRVVHQRTENETIDRNAARQEIDPENQPVGVKAESTQESIDRRAAERAANKGEDDLSSRRTEKFKDKIRKIVSGLTPEEFDALQSDRLQRDPDAKSLLNSRLRDDFKEYLREYDLQERERMMSPENQAETEHQFLTDLAEADPRDVDPVSQAMALDALTGKRSGPKGEDVLDDGFREVKKGGKHDTDKEGRMLNAVLKDIGIDEGVTVKSMKDYPGGKTNSGGDGRTGSGIYSYKPGDPVIYVSDNVHGAERAEVLFHELGHHIYRTEFDKAPVEVRDAIEADYQKWRADRAASKGETVADILASKKGAARAAGILRRADGTTPDMLNDTQHSYLYDREEYVADHISRALASNEQAQGTVERFYAGVAAKLKVLYTKVFGNPKYAGYKPAPSVEAWVQSLFDRQKLGASKAFDQSLSHKQSAIVAEAAVRVAHGVPDEPISSLQRTGESTPGSDTAGEGGNGAPPGGGGDRAGGAGAEPTPSNRPIADIMAHVLQPKERVILERALGNPKVEQALRKLLTPEQASDFDHPETRLLALLGRGYEKWASGELKLGPQASDGFGRIAGALKKAIGILGDDAYSVRIFEDIQNGRIEKARANGSDYNARERASRGAGRLQQIKRAYEDISEKTLIPATRGLLKSMGDRLRTEGVPAMGELVAKIERQVGEHGDADYNTRVAAKNGEFQRRFHDAINSLSDRQLSHVLRRMQRQDFSPSKNTQVRLAMESLQKTFAKAHEYGSEQLNLGERGNFMPIEMDSAKVTRDEAKFRDFLSYPKFDEAIRERFAKWAEQDQDQARADSIRKGEVPHEEFIDRLYKMASRADEVGGHPESIAGNGASPAFRAGRERAMQFVYDVGDAADKRQFARWQSGDARGILDKYAKQLVRRTEYARQFGAKGEILTELLDRAKEQGADEKQVQLMRDYLDMNTGNYGSAFSPTIKKVFGGLDSVFGTKLAQNVTDKSGIGKASIAAMTAYQNARVLPLAVLSSLADPLGIFVRSGGEVNSSFKAVKEGLQQMTKGGDLVRLGNLLGVLDEHMIQESMGATYNSSLSGNIGKLNNFVFKWNGLAGLTKATRVMALSAAQTFMLKHAEGATKGDATSVRYMGELGLKPSDISETDPGRVKVLTDAERDTASPDEIRRDDRVRLGLSRFMEQSILRPTSAQRPGWHSDPYFNLVSQYKGYLYAFHNTIVKRAMQEVNQGNMRVLLPLLAYVPVSLTAEILREFANYGAGGNPRRANWGAGDYAQLAYTKSGLLGPGLSYVDSARSDRSYGRMTGSSLLGPTYQQASDVTSSFVGAKPISSTVEESLPGGSVLQHWL